MKIPLSWLKEYVDIVVPVNELAHRITMAGTEVAEVVTIGGWKDCYVGSVAKVERHPNADRLTLCTVDVGDEQMQVVCGAPNVAENQKIAFAKVGAELYNTHSDKVEPLKAARIRGVVSEGMICSEQELGMGEDHTGILILPEDAPVGELLSIYLGDHILDLDVTPNRPDCLSVLGVAHEVAALTETAVREPDLSYTEAGEPIGTLATVEVADPDLCHRYTASLITNVQIGPSPRWLQDRLLKAGMRPINNVVDITNFVMLEYNQPLHAFDFDTIKERKVVVRRARPGEVLVSLDVVERKLSPSMLVIADARDAVGLGGVIGGAHSEMTERTTTVLLESATFNPTNNRQTAQALRLFTEASTRFEKGLRPELAPIALKRATQLICHIAGGVAARGIIDIFPNGDQYRAPSVTLTMERLQKVLGVQLPIQRVQEVLSSLGFACESVDGAAVRAMVPYWRSDINVEDDLVEEVARIVGYDEIPTTMLSTPIPRYHPQPLQELKERVKDSLVACGIQEVISYSLTSLDDLAKVNAQENGHAPLKLQNSMNSQQEYLRTTLRASLLATLASNRLHGQGQISIFESGRTYLPRNHDLPEEREVIAGVISSPQSDVSGSAAEGRSGFFDVKAIVEKLMEELEVTAAYESAQEFGLHPARCARIVAGDVTLGLVAEIHPAVVSSFDIEGDSVALFELDVEDLLKVLPQGRRRYKPIGRFPSATRDLAIIVSRDVPAARIHEIIQKHPLVAGVRLFDVYAGENIPAGKRSLAYHVVVQSLENTLATEEVNQAIQTILDSLKREVAAELRV